MGLGGSQNVVISITTSELGTSELATTESIHGKLGTDTEFADTSIYDMLGVELATDSIGATLTGTAGIATWKSGAAAANGVSMSEALRYLSENVQNGGTILPATQSLYDLLAGTNGIAAFPAAAVAANDVSMAEVLRYIQEVSTIQTLTRPTNTMPQGTAAEIFTITGGNIEVVYLLGEVTTILGGANASKLTFDPTGAGTSSDICGTLDLNVDAVGIFYTITGTFGDALARSAQTFISKTAAPATLATPITLGPGEIDLDCAGSVSGAIQWTLGYRKLEAASTVVVGVAL